MNHAHLNGNLLGIIDTETTGTVPGFNDIIEFCCIIIGPDLKPAKGITNPFSMEIQPKRLENISLEALRVQGKDLDDVVKEKLCKDRKRLVKIATTGCDADDAADYFGKWWDKLRLAPGKRIMPIAHNWVFDRGFIIDWLGINAFEYYFDPRYRDTMGMALYDNDCADWRGEMFDYPKTHLSYLCNSLGVERLRAHTALDDAVATMNAYRKLVGRTEIRTLPKSIIKEEDMTIGQMEEYISHLQQNLKHKKDKALTQVST